MVSSSFNLVVFVLLWCLLPTISIQNCKIQKDNDKNNDKFVKHLSLAYITEPWRRLHCTPFFTITIYIQGSGSWILKQWWRQPPPQRGPASPTWCRYGPPQPNPWKPSHPSGTALTPLRYSSQVDLTPLRYSSHTSQVALTSLRYSSHTAQVRYC